ncbi:hypothetical protein JCM3765_004015 [Sporobolomyces pararoseus]
MTSSEPTVTPPTSGECVVCGTPTHLRCSKCSEGGINWMCFCSVEHQKMVHKIHKRVCGTNPFEWPALNDAEVEEAYRLRNCKIKTDTSETLLDVILEGLKSNAPKDLVDRYLANGVDAWFHLHLTSLTLDGTCLTQDHSRLKSVLTQERSPTWSLQPLLEYQRTLIMSSGVGEMTGLPDVDSEKAHKILEERIDSTFDLIGGPR